MNGFIQTGERLLSGAFGRNFAYFIGFVAVGAVMAVGTVMKGVLSSGSDSILMASRGVGFVFATALLCAALLSQLSPQRSIAGALGLGALTGFALLPLNYALFWLVVLAGLGGGRFDGYPYGWMAAATVVAALSIKFVAGRLSPPLEIPPPPRGGMALVGWVGAIVLGIAILTSLSRSEQWPGDPLVEVHGRVIDQRGEPVGDVNVVVTVRGGMTASSNGIRTTDDGRFVFRAPGERAVVEQLLHPRITRHVERLPRPSRGSDGREPFFTGFEGYRRFVHRPTGSGSSRSDPRVFRVWRVDDFPEGVHRTRGRLEVEPGKPSLERYGIRFNCRFDTLDGVASSHRWRLTLQPIGEGGFQRAEDLFLSEAPADGYDVQSVVYAPPHHDARWPVSWAGEDPEVWYYRSRASETHGLFAVGSAGVRGGRKEVCSIRFIYLKHVDDGSRNLAIEQSEDGWDRLF